jgi:hypothetical protein
VIRVGVDYLHRAAPFYACYGFGMALYFASQGAGNVLWPFIAGCLRLAVVTLGGWYWISVLHGSLEGLFWIIAASFVLFGACQCGGVSQPASHGGSCLCSRLAKAARPDTQFSSKRELNSRLRMSVCCLLFFQQGLGEGRAVFMLAPNQRERDDQSQSQY